MCVAAASSHLLKDFSFTHLSIENPLLDFHKVYRKMFSWLQAWEWHLITELIFKLLQNNSFSWRVTLIWHNMAGVTIPASVTFMCLITQLHKASKHPAEIKVGAEDKRQQLCPWSQIASEVVNFSGKPRLSSQRGSSTVSGSALRGDSVAPTNLQVGKQTFNQNTDASSQ